MRLILTFLFLSQIACAQETDWKDLFNGKNLDNWQKLGGVAEYKIESGCIVGISKPNTPNTFLTTKKHYGDFILEYEVLVDPVMNSGVQIRSNSYPDYYKGAVHGYQVELDPSPRAFSGGIYDESRRGWLYPLSRNEKGRKALRNGVWNKFRVEAVGNTIKTWVNGIQCANLADDLTAKGFIGLQVHGIGKNLDHAEKEIRWRNIRILETDLGNHVWEDDPEVPQLSFLINQLSDYEKRKGWRLLWDGKTSEGWRSAASENFPEKGWEMTDGELKVLANGSGGDIMTKEQFSEFELELEFKITKGANSGIKYFVNPELTQKEGSGIGLEFQILDDKNHPDAKEGIGGNRTVGSLYDLIPAEGHTIEGRDKQFKGVGAWNHVRIVVKNGKVEHWLNGEKTVEYDRFSQTFRALIQKSKYKDWEGFGQWSKGHILLQDHGDEVSFRNVKIREF